VTIDSEEDFSKLCTDENDQAVIDGHSLKKANVRSFSFGRNFYLHTLPNNFLTYFTNLNGEIDFPSCITEISDYFMNNCTSFNGVLNFTSIESIGNDFMSGCRVFNNGDEELVLDNIESIPDNFLSGCSSFNQVIDF
jgi:hypothetical protein